MSPQEEYKEYSMEELKKTHAMLSKEPAAHVSMRMAERVELAIIARNLEAADSEG